ncbi:MAG: TonB-dependent receptor [Acidobacteriia bacterium]|nr:TonB-dependent receptor [Terriglobia bacterium]
MKSFRFISCFMLGCFALFFASVSAYAQGGDVGSIVGAVTDQSGGSISGATVTVLDTQRGVARTLTTDDAGQYNAPNLTPGTYNVKAEFRGFQAIQRQNILIQVGTQIRVDLSLQPGEQNQTITVTEEVPLIQTTNASLGGALSNELISDLPLNGRNYTRLLDLQPGMYVQPGSGKWGQSSNGMRAEHNVYILDGVDTVEGFSSQSVLNSSPVFGDATSILPIDAIQEFNTQQNPSAEYGWKPGAIVNVGLKSGTNTLHGTASAFGRDSALDATNPFIPVGNAKQQTAIETYGATIGGPIVRDKLFFFVGYEGQMNHISAPSSQDSLPTIADLSTIAGTSPATQKTFSLLNACNALTVAPNALSLKLAGLTYGGANGSCAVSSPYSGIFQTAAITNGADPVTPIGDDKLNNGLVKIDYHLSDKHSFSGEYFIGNFDGLGFQGAPAQPYWDITSHARSMVIGGHWTWLASSNVVNEFHVGVNRFFQPSYPGDCSNIGQPSGETGINWGTQSTVIPQTGQPANCGMPSLTIQGFTATGCCTSFPKIQGPDYTTQFIDSVSYIRGTHSFRFGGEYRRMSTQEGTFSGSRGNFTFANGAAGPCTGPTCTGLQEFLLGNLSSNVLPSELVGTPDVTVRDSSFALFAQDDWRIKPNFTVNLGVRFERVTPIKEANNQLANFDPTSPTGLVQISSSGSLYPAWNSWSPRLGFAWDVTGNSKWVLRGGFNIMYVLEGFNVFISQQGTSPITTGLNTIPTGALLNGAPGPGNMQTATLSFQPSQLSWSLAGPIFPAIASGQLQCNSPTSGNPCAILAVNPNLRRPYAPAYNLSLQHAFTSNLSLQVAYVGSHGVKLLGLNDANPPAVGSGWETKSGSTCVPGTGPATSISTFCQNITRPFFSKFPYLSDINEIQNLDNSNYNSLQVTLTQHPWHGLDYLVGYVYGHCMEMGSGDWNGAILPSNVYNPKADYGNCLTDVRHSLTWSMSYALPGKKGYAQMLEGWKINSIVKYQTALPWNITDTKNNISGTGEGEDRWSYFGQPGVFSDQKSAGVPFVPGAGLSAVNFANATSAAQFSSDPACAAQAATLDASYTQAFAGWAKNAAGIPNGGYEAALNKFGCFDLNGSVMLAPAFGTFGNEGRNMFRGEPFRLWDLSVVKEVRFTERLNAQFRFEAFNVLNMTQFYTNSGNPSVTGSFGSSRQTPDVGIANATVGSGGPRSIQIGMRLQF